MVRDFWDILYSISMSSNSSFVIVSFVNEDGAVAIVPCSWLIHGSQVLRPPAELKGYINRMVREEG